MSNFADLTESLLKSHVSTLRTGMEAGAAAERRAILAPIQALDHAYRRAALDPEMKIPSYLQAAIFNAIQLLNGKDAT